MEKEAGLTKMEWGSKIVAKRETQGKREKGKDQDKGYAWMGAELGDLNQNFKYFFRIYHLL